MEVNVNQNFNSIDSTLNLGNNFIDSESNNRNSEAHNIQESNNNIPIAAPNAIFLPNNHDPTFPDIVREKEDNEVQVASPSGSSRKSLWPQ